MFFLSPFSNLQCTKIVEEVDQIIQLIEKDVDPKGICEKIGLCANTTITTDGTNAKTTSLITPSGKYDISQSFTSLSLLRIFYY